MTPFRLIQTTLTPSGFRAMMSTDKDSVIYKAHFPNGPITPGACLIQAVCDLMESQLGRKLLLREIKNVKFLSVIIPDGLGDILFDVQQAEDPDDPQSVDVKVAVSKADAVCARMSLVFKSNSLAV